jgi:hypothetical protein
MTNESVDEVAEIVLGQVDFANPDLAGVQHLMLQHKTREAAIALAGYLRRRETPRQAFSLAFIRDLRARATAEQKLAARQALEKALEAVLITGVHGNPISTVGPVNTILGITPDLCRQIADRILESREHWDNGPWGVTHSIVNLLRLMACLPECPDDALVPPLAWLLAQSRHEWKWARTWSESMLGNSGHNWWLHTFLGFFKAGLFFPEFKDLARFRSLGAAFFEREALILLESDGFTKERSGYHYGTAAMFFEFQDLAAEHGFPISPEYQDRLRAAAAVEWKVLAPTGDLPHLGDGFADYKDGLRSLEDLRRLAARFQSPEAKFVAEQLSPGWTPTFSGLLLQGEHNLLPAYERLSARAPASPDTVLPATGYYFMRQDWTPRADWVSIEAGPTGTIVSSHDHTDIFSLELYSRGRAILVDNGSGPYGNEPSRVWRVGSAGHNVAMIDGQDQIPMDSKFPEWRWTQTVTPFIDAWISDARYAYFSGAHEGYRALPERVASARRKLFYRRGRYWILIDRFTPETEAEHDYGLHFHVRPPCRLEPDGRLLTTGEGGNLLMVPVPGLEGRAAIEPCPHPLDHYVKPDHLSYTRRGKGPQIFVTLLVPFEGAVVPAVSVQSLAVESDERTLSPWEATALEITIDGRREVYFDQHMAWNLPWRAGGFSGEGRLFHSECR